MSEKIKKALRIAVNVGCGFEADAEDAAELLTLITGLESRIAELERDCDMLFRSAANEQYRKNIVSQKFVYGKEREE
jgi:hypothetical protein